jgi:hypothetical protein
MSEDVSNVAIGYNQRVVRFQCLGCFRAFTSYTPFSAAFAQHVTECVAHPFPYDLPEEFDESAVREMYESGTLDPYAGIEWIWDEEPELTLERQISEKPGFRQESWLRGDAQKLWNFDVQRARH